MIRASLLDMLRCIKCNGALRQIQVDAIRCVSCGVAYPVEGGFPAIQPDEYRPVVDVYRSICNEFSMLESLKVGEVYPVGRYVMDLRLEKFNRTFVGRIRSAFPGRAKVLDIGCSSGIFSRRLADRGLHVYGIDILHEILSVNASLSKDHIDSGMMELAVANGLKLPFADGSFQGVCCLETLEHTKEPNRMLSEMMRVLKPGGILYLTTPVRDTMALLHSMRKILQGVMGHKEVFDKLANNADIDFYNETGDEKKIFFHEHEFEFKELKDILR